MKTLHFQTSLGLLSLHRVTDCLFIYSTRNYIICILERRFKSFSLLDLYSFSLYLSAMYPVK